MSKAKNKIRWCINKAEKELKETGKHRGLLKIKSDIKEAREHIKKAEHNLNGAITFSETGFSDWSASAFFYTCYHCFLAIGYKFGYESGNQECTFALMENLIEDKKIDFDKELLDRVASLDVEKQKETTGIAIREQYQYGTKLSIEDDLYKELLELAKNILEKTKEIIEE